MFSGLQKLINNSPSLVIDSKAAFLDKSIAAYTSRPNDYSCVNFSPVG